MQGQGTFTRPRFALAAVVSGMIASTSLAGPTPVIQISATQGAAPFAVHAHALNTTLSVGDVLTAQYEWNFGDTAGQFNKVNGWNASHIYDIPGTYQVKLIVTDQAGAKVTTTVPVTITASNRSTIYVSAAGNDSNAGTSTSAPVRTAARAQQLLSANRAILFRRGDTFDVSSEFNISQQNVQIGAYGTGNNPVLNWSGPASTYSGIVGMSGTAKDVVLESLVFDCPTAISLSIVRGIEPAGSNITVRNCNFKKVSYAIDGERTVDGFLALNDTTGVIGAYFVWGVGKNYTILGNTIGGSQSQHLIRLGGVDRCLIASNTLTNTSNSTVWAMLGSYAYIANNTLRGGRCLVGPNQAVGSPSERFPYAVIENNTMWDETFGADPGAQHVAIRNNISHSDGRTAIGIAGYISSMNRQPVDIRILNNTAINNSSVGRFVKVAAGAQQVMLCNNLYDAPALVPASSETANVDVADSSLASFTQISHNVWAIPASTPWVAGARHYVWPSWSDAAGYKTAAQWSAFSTVSSDIYENPTLGADFKPASTSLTATAGLRMPGVQTDFYGNVRPTGNVWTAGAVQSGSGTVAPPPPPPPPVTPGDVNGDHVVNIDDLVKVLSHWGTCPAPCPSDLTGNGVVNVDDLTRVINNWS